MIVLSYCFTFPFLCCVPQFSVAFCMFLSFLFLSHQKKPFPLNGPLALLWVSVKSLYTPLILPFHSCFRGNNIKEVVVVVVVGVSAFHCCSRSHRNLNITSTSQITFQSLSPGRLWSSYPYFRTFLMHLVQKKAFFHLKGLCIDNEQKVPINHDIDAAQAYISLINTWNK